jgi:hypothetical protein
LGGEKWRSVICQARYLASVPVANDAGAHLAILRPGLWEAVVDDVVGFDAKRVLDDLGGAIGVVAGDGWRRKIGTGIGTGWCGTDSHATDGNFQKSQENRAFSHWAE